MKFAVEWKRQYYRVAGKRELDLILAMPEKFLDSDLKLPKSLPRSLEVTLARQRLKSAELDGFCPITFKVRITITMNYYYNFSFEVFA